MLTQHRLLLAAPPAIRSEIIRQAFSPRYHSSAARYTVTGARIFRPKHINPQQPLPIAVAGRPFLSANLITPLPTSRSASTAAAGATYKAPTPPPKRSRLGRFFLTTSLVCVFWAAGFAMAAAPAGDVVNGFLNGPTDAETLTLFEPPTPTAAEINEHIANHPLAARLRTQEHMVESRPHMKIPAAMRQNNFTGGTLLGPGMLEVPPLTFTEKGVELPEMYQLMYLGNGLCGHPGIVHGGLLATMLDEGLARACFDKLPNKFGVTANLKIDYRVPCPAGKYAVLRAQTIKVEGRKAWVKGWIELLNEEGETGIKVVEAEALYIEPKGASTVGKLYTNGH